MTAVIWTRPALRDLESIGDYIFRENPAAAATIVTRILDRADGLAEHPALGRSGRVSDTRELVVTETPFIVVYRVREQRVHVVAVFHGARRWPETFA